MNKDEQISGRRDVFVGVPAERAFQIFTAEFDRVKPREHNLLRRRDR